MCFHSYVECSEKTDLKWKTETDSERECMVTAMRGLGSGGIEQKGKRTHGQGQQCGDLGVGGEGV